LASSDGSPGPVDMPAWGRHIETVEPTWMLKYLPNMAACHTTILLDLQGPSNSITSDDAASLLALGEAFRIIARGDADGMLVGASESKISILSLARHNLFLPLSKRNDEPAKACRPFDADRDGMVIGEGAAVLVLEDLEHARQRGAAIKAEVCGYGAAFDVRRDGSGLARAIAAALAEAKVTPAELDHVNAHGYGAPELDLREAAGLRAAVGGVPVFAAKGYIGNLGAAAGLAELYFDLLATAHRELPPTLNCDRPDLKCAIAVHNRGLRPIAKPYALKVAYTDLGQCAAVVLRS
jgi:3-oxoacyl-[acyl-carrier-protein] synthase II